MRHIAVYHNPDSMGYAAAAEHGPGERYFHPRIALTDEAWFEDFKRSQGSFAFGFHPIRDTRFVRALEAVAERGDRK